MKNLSKKTQRELVKKEGWIYSESHMGLFDQPISADLMARYYDGMELNGFHKGKKFRFIETEKCFSYKVCGTLYVLKKGN